MGRASCIYTSKNTTKISPYVAYFHHTWNNSEYQHPPHTYYYNVYGIISWGLPRGQTVPQIISTSHVCGISARSLSHHAPHTHTNDDTTSTMASTAAHGPPWPSGIRSDTMSQSTTSWSMLGTLFHFISCCGGCFGHQNATHKKLRDGRWPPIDGRKRQPTKR